MKFRSVSGKAVQHLRRKTKQEEAKKRQALRDKLSPKEQLKVIAKRPGKSQREVTRLKTIIEKGG